MPVSTSSNQIKTGLHKMVNSTKPTTAKTTSISLKMEKKLALSIKTKLNDRVNSHKITINKKEVPSLKTSDPTIKSVNKSGQWRAITTKSINQQSNSIANRDVKLQLSKRQLKG